MAAAAAASAEPFSAAVCAKEAAEMDLEDWDTQADRILARAAPVGGAASLVPLSVTCVGTSSISFELRGVRTKNVYVFKPAEGTTDPEAVPLRWPEGKSGPATLPFKSIGNLCFSAKKETPSSCCFLVDVDKAELMIVFGNIDHDLDGDSLAFDGASVTLPFQPADRLRSLSPPEMSEVFPDVAAECVAGNPLSSPEKAQARADALGVPGVPVCLKPGKESQNSTNNAYTVVKGAGNSKSYRLSPVAEWDRPVAIRWTAEALGATAGKKGKAAAEAAEAAATSKPVFVSGFTVKVKAPQDLKGDAEGAYAAIFDADKKHQLGRSKALGKPAVAFLAEGATTAVLEVRAADDSVLGSATLDLGGMARTRKKATVALDTQGTVVVKASALKQTDSFGYHGIERVGFNDPSESDPDLFLVEADKGLVHVIFGKANWGRRLGGATATLRICADR